METFYDVLRVRHDATLEQIKRAYKQRAMEYHPDVSTNNRSTHEMMCKINEAYSVLRNVETRMAYDELLKERGQYCSTSTPDNDPNPQPHQFKSDVSKKRRYQYESYEERFERYSQYNTFDFYDYEQEYFIDWIEEFSSYYLAWVLDYQKITNIKENDLFDKLYTLFNNIIDTEKVFMKEKSKPKKMNTL